MSDPPTTTEFGNAAEAQAETTTTTTVGSLTAQPEVTTYIPLSTQAKGVQVATPVAASANPDDLAALLHAWRGGEGSDTNEAVGLVDFRSRFFFFYYFFLYGSVRMCMWDRRPLTPLAPFIAVSREDFASLHISGSSSIPLAEYEARGKRRLRASPDWQGAGPAGGVWPGQRNRRRLFHRPLDWGAAPDRLRAHDHTSHSAQRTNFPRGAPLSASCVRPKATLNGYLHL